MNIHKKIHSTTKLALIIVLIVAIIGAVLYLSTDTFTTDNKDTKLAKLVNETGSYMAVYEFIDTGQGNEEPARIETIYDGSNYKITTRQRMEQTRVYATTYKRAEEPAKRCYGILGDAQWTCNEIALKSSIYVPGDIEKTMHVKRAELSHGAVIELEPRRILDKEAMCYEQVLVTEHAKAEYCFDEAGNPLYFSYEKEHESFVDKIQYQVISYELGIGTETFDEPVGPVM